MPLSFNIPAYSEPYEGDEKKDPFCPALADTKQSGAASKGNAFKAHDRRKPFDLLGVLNMNKSPEYQNRFCVVCS